MPIKDAMAHTMNSAVRLPMLIRLEVKQSGSAHQLDDKHHQRGLQNQAGQGSLSFQIS